MSRIKWGLLCFISAWVTTVWGNDTLRITIQQADSIFLAKNFDLLIAALKVDQKAATVIQSKLYPNPVFTADVNGYDPDNKKVFHWGNTGQQSFQMEQLILLGGKRKSWIEIAKSEKEIAELELKELLQTLKFQLRTSFYQLDQLSMLIEKYDKQIKMLNTIIEAYETQSTKGNISLKDVVRLKGASLNLRGEKADLIRAYTEQLLRIQMLLQTNQIVKPMVKDQMFLSKIKVFDEKTLVEEALKNRPDFQISKRYQELASLNYSMEKRMAVPDLTVFSSYDRRGGAFNHQVNVGVSIPLTLWNRNQGNIKVAELQKQEMDLSAQQAQLKLVTEVKGYLVMYNRAVRDFEVSNQLFSKDFDITAEGMIQGFQRGNIALIEFVDFFESYNEALSDFSNIKVQLAIAAEQLNVIVGSEHF